MTLEELMEHVAKFEYLLNPPDGEHLDPSDEIGYRDMLREEFAKFPNAELPECLKHPK